MLQLIFSLFLLQASASTPFRFHVLEEPGSLDPLTYRASLQSYLLNTIYRPLLVYRGKKLVGAGARECKFTAPTVVECDLNKLKYSSGGSIVAADYVRTVQAAFQQKSFVTDRLLNLTNAKAILRGDKKPEELGVKALADLKVQFKLEQPDIDFLYELVDPALAPRPEAKIDGHFSGPFQVQEWRHADRLILKANPNFVPKPQLADVEVLFVSEDDTGLRLFEKHEVDFLRRLTADSIEKYKNHPGFMQVPLLRFDYIGFGRKTKIPEAVRKEILTRPNFNDFARIFDALGRPGCFGLSPDLLKPAVCLLRDKPERRLESTLAATKFTFYFSSAGGDDIARAAQWFQHEWKKTIKVEALLQPLDNQSLQAKLDAGLDGVFRRGVPLSKPTCRSALEIFQRESRDNFVGFSNKQYETYIDRLRVTADPIERNSLCGLALRELMQANLVLPLGQIHFTMLRNPKLKNLEINELNQLFLDATHY